MILSILTCHITQRRESLRRLFHCIGRQCGIGWPEWDKMSASDFTNFNLLFDGMFKDHGMKFYNGIEFLIQTDNREASTGWKRNALLERAGSDYICFIDDDDLYIDGAIQRMLDAVKQKPDVVGMEGLLYLRAEPPEKFVHSIQYKMWRKHNGVYERPPNHLNPVKRDLAREVSFPDKTIGEDFDYSTRLLPLLSTEVYIDTPIYRYNK